VLKVEKLKFTIDSVKLNQSTLTSEGAEYREVPSYISDDLAKFVEENNEMIVWCVITI